MPSLISKEQLDGTTQPLVALNLRDMEQAAQQTLERARAEARRILSEALSRAREMERVAAGRGEKEGFQAGMKQGAEAGHQEALEAETRRIQEHTATVREALLEMVAEIDQQRHEVITDAKQGLLALAVAIARRLCRASIEQTRDHLRPVVEEVIETVGQAGAIVVRANPADVKAVEQFLDDVRGATDAQGGVVRLVADEAVSPGGCVAERAAGKVDARIETQIERIVAELIGGDVSAPDDAADQGDTA